MGRRPVEKRITQLRVLTPRAKEALRRTVAGQRRTDVAKDLKYTTIHLSKIVHSCLGKEYMEKLETQQELGVSKIAQMLNDLDILSVEILKRTFEAALEGDPKERIRKCPAPAQIRAAERHLQRQGYVKPSQVNVFHGHVATSKVLAELKRRRAELEQKDRKVIIGEIVRQNEREGGEEE